MKTHPHSAFCDRDYLRSPEELAPSRAPCWLRTGLAISIGFFVALLAATLLGPMDESVTAGGEVRPADYTLVLSPAEGRFAEVFVREGDTVTAGQPVARLDPWEADKRVAVAAQELAEARAALALAAATRRKVEAVPVPPEFFFSPVEKDRQQEILDVRQETKRRLEELNKVGGVSRLDLLNQRLDLIAAESLLRRNEQAQTLLEGPYGEASIEEARHREAVAAARVQALETTHRLALADRARLDLVAPAAGQVSAITRRFPGEPVSEGAPLLKIIRGPGQELRLFASEDRLPAIRPGQLVRFQARRNADKLARPAIAHVEQVALEPDLPESLSTDEPRTYRIVARIAFSPYPLPNGAAVDAEIVLRKRSFWEVLLRSFQRR